MNRTIAIYGWELTQAEKQSYLTITKDLFKNDFYPVETDNGETHYILGTALGVAQPGRAFIFPTDNCATIVLPPDPVGISTEPNFYILHQILENEVQ